MITKDEAISLWKENKISRCEMDFSCGGDSMNDWNFKYFDSNDDEVICEELSEKYFDEEVFNKVEFYVNSDGHYIGEAGIVYIELDDEENEFSYNKTSESEWNETITNTLEISLSEKHINYIKEYVRSIVGGSDESAQFNYSKDFIMTNEHEEIEEEITKIVDDVTTYFVPETENEVQDWFTFQSQEPMFENNKLLVEINNETTIFREE